jgi:hypothetical protein
VVVIVLVVVVGVDVTVVEIVVVEVSKVAGGVVESFPGLPGSMFFPGIHSLGPKMFKNNYIVSMMNT